MSSESDRECYITEGDGPLSDRVAAGFDWLERYAKDHRLRGLRAATVLLPRDRRNELARCAAGERKRLLEDGRGTLQGVRVNVALAQRAPRRPALTPDARAAGLRRGPRPA